MNRLLHNIKAFASGVYHVFLHEFSLVRHDLGIIIFVAFLPLGYPVVYSLIYNPELVKEVPFVVVDSDRTSQSRELVRRLDACDEARLLGYAADLPEARRAMDSHKCYAILEIPKGFQRHIGRGETAPAVMYCDMTLLLRYRGFIVATTDVASEMGSEIQQSDLNRILPLAGTLVTGDPMPVNNIPMGNITQGFDSFIMPGVLILIFQQCIVLAMGMAGGARRERPSLIGYDPHNNAPSVLGTMIGQGLCYYVILLIPSLFMIHYVPMMFSFPMAGNIWQECLLMLPLTLASIGMAFCIQALVTEREAIFLIWVVTSMMFLLLSGLIWPRYAMPGFWRALSDISPATWGIEAFIKMNSNGATLAQVRHPYIMLWTLTGAWWAVGYAVQRWIVRPAALRSVPTNT